MMAIYAMNYNFCRIHQTLRVTPAMESGIANHVWTIEEIASLPVCLMQIATDVREGVAK